MSEVITLTHKQAVRRVSAWLKYSKACSVVMAELATKNSETPDAIGFHGHGASILVECKVSRSDFLADKHKFFRRDEDRGVGDARYFAAPKGIISEQELPEGWGLLVIHATRIDLAVEPKLKTANKRAEVIMLMSAIRRLEISTAVYVRHEELPPTP